MTKRLALMLALAPAAFSQHRYGREWPVHEEENIEKAFSVPASAGPQSLLVDNISGYIHVTGSSGTEIRVRARKRIGAATTAALAEAKKDVKLDMSQTGNSVRLYVDGPFRTPNGVNYRGDDYYGYRVAFDYDIEVPTATGLNLKTINEGAIEVRKTAGDFVVNGLNGGIEMEDVAGSGTVRTLNGPVRVSFAKNPSRNSEFRTLNGKIDIYFQRELNADLNFRTLNGAIYTDFDVTTRPVAVNSAPGVNSRFVYRSDRRKLAVRAGNGGPELSFDALNGEIRLHSKGL